MDLSRVCSSCSRGTDEDIIFDLDHYSVVGWVLGVESIFGNCYLLTCYSVFLYFSFLSLL